MSAKDFKSSLIKWFQRGYEETKDFNPGPGEESEQST